MYGRIQARAVLIKAGDLIERRPRRRITWIEYVVQSSLYGPSAVYGTRGVS